MRCGLLVVALAAAMFVAAAVSPSARSAGAKSCHKGYTHAVFPWGERCVRSGQYCKKVRNPEYHRYLFQCVNGKLKKQPGQKNGKTK